MVAGTQKGSGLCMCWIGVSLSLVVDDTTAGASRMKISKSWCSGSDGGVDGGEHEREVCRVAFCAQENVFRKTRRMKSGAASCKTMWLVSSL